MPVELEVAGLAQALDMFQQGNARVGLALKRATTASVALLRKRLAKYPGKSSGKMEFVSDKQRRFFFAALREGKIHVPYQRTVTLGKRWTTEVSRRGDDLVGKVGNATVYGPFVQSVDQQAAIHRGRWRTDEQVARLMEPNIQALFEARIQAAMP